MQESSCNCGENIDYKEVANELQKDLREKTKEIEYLKEKLTSLEEKWTRSSLLNGSLQDELKELEERNKELKDENQYLNKENDKQAFEYTKTRKILGEECSRYKTILKDEFGYSDDDDTEKEKRLRGALLEKMNDFAQYTDMESLAPHLITSELLTNDESTKIRTNPSPKEATMHFYTRVLPMKGARAYTTFYKCLKKAEKDPNFNAGHKHLLKIFGSVK